MDILGVHMDEFLLGMLAAALWGHVYHVPFKELEHCLLDTFAGHVTGDGGIVSLAGDLVYLVDEDYSPLGLLHIEVGLLQQAGKDTLHVFSDIAGLGQDRSIHDRERDIQQLGDGPCKQGLAGPGGSDKKDVRLLELDSVVRGFPQVVVDPLVMVVDSHGKHLLGPVLPNHIFIKEGLDVLGFLQVAQLSERFAFPDGVDGIHEIIMREGDTVAADEPFYTLKQEGHVFLGSSTEHAMPWRACFLSARHLTFSSL